MDVPPPERPSGFNRRAWSATTSPMDFALTLALLAGCACLGLFAGWRGARPPDPLRGPRLVPWRFLMMLAACAGLVLLVHLVNLLGVRTGR